LTKLNFLDKSIAMIAQQQQQWFFSSGGERYGPVGFDYLLELAQKGGLDPRNDLVWSTSLNDWEPAGEVAGLFERRAVRREDASMEGSHALAQTGDYTVTPIPKGHFQGTERMGFVMGAMVVPLAMVIGWQFAMPLMTPHVPEEYVGYLPWVVWPLAGFLSLASTVKRLQNVGMTGWWLPGFLVPLLNLWLGFRCLACPGGYAERRKLDGIGKLVAFFYWGAILGSLGLMAAGMIGVFGEIKESGVIGDFTKQFEDLRKSAVPER
jgi:uncharacterized membrane protein YhaH (DUF805 family)